MANRAFVDARSRVDPASGACWIEAGGAYAMFDGPESPLTQTFGLGMFSAPTEAQLDALERFFFERGAAVHHETSPVADPALIAMLADRGYRPIEYSNVMFRPVALPLAGAADSPIRVTHVGSADLERWANVAADGWSSEGAHLADFVRGIGVVQANSKGFHAFIATLDGRDVAAGGLFIDGPTAILAGASTVPNSRRQGAQLALLAARLRHASEAGCELAMMVALPGSGSQRNAERHGFRVAYTRIKWRREIQWPDASTS